MSARGQAKQLFEYISNVYAIDMPVARDVTAYGAELWWLTDLVPCSQCVVREFDAASSENDQGGEGMKAMKLLVLRSEVSPLRRVAKVE